jgi:hypothetical protein
MLAADEIRLNHNLASRVLPNGVLVFLMFGMARKPVQMFVHLLRIIRFGGTIAGLLLAAWWVTNPLGPSPAEAPKPRSAP